MLRLAALGVVAAVMTVTPSAFAQGGYGWEPYLDTVYGFSADLPLGSFEVIETDGTSGLALREIGGEATVNLNGGSSQGMTPEALEAQMESATRVATTTYRAGGDSWFVLSGFYDDGALDDTIFYTKVLFSPNRETFAAFEITFPEREKPRFEDLVEHFEDNFTRPRG